MIIKSNSHESGQWDHHDTVSVHLLLETAMGDSQQYRILSPDEVDNLKREIATISSRVDATKRKLALEVKLRDATQSVNRLYSAKEKDGSEEVSFDTGKAYRKPSKRGGDIQPRDKDDDLNSDSTKKCEYLAEQLWKLDRKEQGMQRQLLEHTAGVLQMTHKGYLKKEPAPYDLDLNDAQEFVNQEFGDLSHYRPYSQMAEHNASSDKRFNALNGTEFAQHNQLLIDLGNRVEDLNARLRDMILELKPRKEELPDPPRQLDDDPVNVEDILFDQVDFLGNCLETMHQLQNHAKRELQTTNLTAEGRLKTLNTKMHKIMTQTSQEQSAQYPVAPEASGQSLEDQLDYLEGGLGAMDRRIRHFSESLEDTSTKLTECQHRAEQYASMVESLWNILNTSLDPATSDLHDEFSLEAFSRRVQDLHARAIELQKHKSILTSQVQQQRELNESADEAKDTRFASARADLDTAKQQLAATNLINDEQQKRLYTLTAELAAAKQLIELREKQIETKTSEAVEAERSARIQAEDAAEQKLVKIKTEFDETKARLAVMEVNALTLRSDLEGKAQVVAKSDASMKELETEIIRLQTELTFSKAELDGAYGTRAERAAETAPDPALHDELVSLKTHNSSLSAELKALNALLVSTRTGNDKLQARVDALQHELSDTIGDYEAMTKASIDFEKEREQLENLVDNLRDRIESLDGQLSDEKVQLIGLKSPGLAGSRDSFAGGSTSTMVLKNEFKKMMRETRAEHGKALRVRCQIDLLALTKLIIGYRSNKRNAGDSKVSFGH